MRPARPEAEGTESPDPTGRMAWVLGNAFENQGLGGVWCKVLYRPIFVVVFCEHDDPSSFFPVQGIWAWLCENGQRSVH